MNKIFRYPVNTVKKFILVYTKANIILTYAIDLSWACLLKKNVIIVWVKYPLYYSKSIEIIVYYKEFSYVL